MKVKSGHYNGPETCRTAFVIPDHKAILLLLLLYVEGGGDTVVMFYGEL